MIKGGLAKGVFGWICEWNAKLARWIHEWDANEQPVLFDVANQKGSDFANNMRPFTAWFANKMRIHHFAKTPVDDFMKSEGFNALELRARLAGAAALKTPRQKTREPAKGCGLLASARDSDIYLSIYRSIYVYIYIYIYVHACVYIYIYTHMFISIHLSIYVSLSIHMYIYIYVYISLCI